jgi:hypothetical protein
MVLTFVKHSVSETSSGSDTTCKSEMFLSISVLLRKARLSHWKTKNFKSGRALHLMMKAMQFPKRLENLKTIDIIEIKGHVFFLNIFLPSQFLVSFFCPPSVFFNFIFLTISSFPPCLLHFSSFSAAVLHFLSWKRRFI